MFTGLVTDVGTVKSREDLGDVRLVFQTGYDLTAVEYGASIACNGVCLTVVDKGYDWFAVDASGETCRVTTLGDWIEGRPVNFERSLKLGDEMGGHIVSGHIDTVGAVASITAVGDSWKMDIEVDSEFGHLLAAKGSVAVDGISLTVNAVEDAGSVTRFSVNVIPHTRSVTSVRDFKAGTRVNVEFDMLARYVARISEKG